MWNVPEEEELRGSLTSTYTHPPRKEPTYTKLAANDVGTTGGWFGGPVLLKKSLLCSEISAPWGSLCLFCMSDLQEPPLPHLSSKAVPAETYHSKTKKQGHPSTKQEQQTLRVREGYVRMRSQGALCVG